MKKFLLMLLVVLTVTFSMAFATNYTDLPVTHWAYKPISEMTEKNILSGYPDGSFAPDNSITRAEFAKILVLTLNLTSTSSDVSFEDVPTTHWAHNYISTASNYLSGYSIGTTLLYMPDSDAVREDIALAIVNAAGLQNSNYKISTLNKFTDKDSISENLKKYVAIAVENDLMHGNTDGTFNPKGKLTRAEVSQLMINVLSLLEKIAVSDINDETVEVTKVTLNEDDVTIKDGESIKLTVKLMPSNATDKTVTWTSSNTRYATVEDGVVNGIMGEKTVTITATTSNGKKAKCKVTIECNHKYSSITEYEIINDDTHAEGICCNKCLKIIPESKKIVAHSFDNNKCKCGYIKPEDVTTTIDNTVSKEVIDLLGDLDIMTEAFNKDSAVTNAEAVSYVVRLINCKQAAKLCKGKYGKISSDHWANGYYCVAKESKLFNGLDEDKLEPETNITNKEFITMVINALGYGNIAKSSYNGYMAQATQLDLFKDIGSIDADAYTSKGIAAKILYNALNTQMWDIKEEEGSLTYAKTEKTLKEIKFGE